MTAFLSLFSTLAPYHQLAHSLLLGATAHQIFFILPFMYITLPYDEFCEFHRKISRAHLPIQIILVLVVFCTAPGNILKNLQVCIEFIWLLGYENYYTGLMVELMEARKEQENIDGQSYNDPNPSKKMRALNMELRIYCSLLMLLRLSSFIIFAFYCFTLSDNNDSNNS